MVPTTMRFLVVWWVEKQKRFLVPALWLGNIMIRLGLRNPRKKERKTLLRRYPCGTFYISAARCGTAPRNPPNFWTQMTSILVKEPYIKLQKSFRFCLFDENSPVLMKTHPYYQMSTSCLIRSCIPGGFVIFETNMCIQWNPVYNAFHRIRCYGKETNWS